MDYNVPIQAGVGGHPYGPLVTLPLHPQLANDWYPPTQNNGWQQQAHYQRQPYGPMRQNRDNYRRRNKRPSGGARQPVENQRIEVWRDRIIATIGNRLGHQWLTPDDTEWVQDLVQSAVDYDRLLLVRFSAPSMFETVMRIVSDYINNPKQNPRERIERKLRHRAVHVLEDAMQWCAVSLTDEIIECDRRRTDDLKKTMSSSADNTQQYEHPDEQPRYEHPDAEHKQPMHEPGEIMDEYNECSQIE
jgi:hypothetical protein